LIQKKKILIFIDWFLPGYKAGGPIQSCANLISHLKDEFEFSVITRDADYCETEPYPGIISNSWNTLPDGTRVFYISRENLKYSNIKNLLAREEYDCVYLNGIYSLYFTLMPLYSLKKISQKNIRVIVAARGMLAESAIAVKKTKKNFFLFISRLTGLFKPVVFHATSEDESVDIQSNFGKDTKVLIAPNLPKKVVLTEPEKKEKRIGELRLINIARIAPEKNLLFALQVLKEIKTTGKIQFDIYGPSYDENYRNACWKLITEMPSNIKLNYKGSLPVEEVPHTLSLYHFLFMPTRGENFGHVIIESLSAGTPVIISDQTIWKSLHLKNSGWDIPLTDKEKYKTVIMECLEMDEEKYNFLSRKSFETSRIFIDNQELVGQSRRLFS
jgi:glycosyltransferase involved in cell wall biosynthesis